VEADRPQGVRVIAQQNFAALLDASARRAPHQLAVADSTERLTYEVLERRASAVAAALAERGGQPGDRVALALPNGVAFVVALYACFRLGATVTPLNPQLTPDERAKILADFSPRLTIDELPRSSASFDTVASLGAPALVLYTSGSTGRPKGAVLSHKALIAANRAWAEPMLALTASDRVLAVLPLSHSFGINGALLAPLIAGATVVIVERFSPELVVAAVRGHAVTVFPGVATMFRRLLDAGGWSRDDFASLRFAVSGAAPCPWALAEEWRERTGRRILRGYGMTEMFRPVSYLANDPRDFPDSIGRPVPGVEIRVVDDDGKDVAPGETGELLLKSDASMDEYLAQPEETAAVLIDGWFRTGDLVRISTEGFVTVVGRKKDLILRGGYSVYPAEVEAALIAHPSVAEAAVVGVPHEVLGEEVTAFVTLRPATTATADDLIAWCKTRVAGYKCPRVVTIVTELPKSATGKVVKSRLVPVR
jgi:long-chain acyl-CoA synthetase